MLVFWKSAKESTFLLWIGIVCNVLCIKIYNPRLNVTEEKSFNSEDATCLNSFDVQFCSSCHRHIEERALCQCDKWVYKNECLKQQMKCKRKCGVCLPLQAQRGRTWSDCYDHLHLCDSYRDMGYCHVYEKWMKAYCKYSCGYCKACKDDSEGCLDWSRKGYCKTIPTYMLKHCRKSCNGCNCYDRSAYCKIWASNQQCVMNPIAMKEKCPLSCDICGIGNAQRRILIRPATPKKIASKKPTQSTTTQEEPSTNSITTQETNIIKNYTRQTPSTLTTTTTPVTNSTTTITTTTTAKTTTTTTTTTATTALPSTTPVTRTEMPTTQLTTTAASQNTTRSPRQTISHQHKVVINDEHCGESPTRRFRRIVGGDELGPPRSWPFIIGITSAFNPERVDCGGSILTNWFILSAAHCFVRPGGMDPSIYTIRFIEHDLYLDEGYEIFRKIDRIYVHQMYSENYDNDLVLLRLTEPIYFSNNVRPACIANTNEQIKTGSFCYVAGWGFRASGIPGPPQLHVVKVPIVDWEECKIKYSLLLEEVTERMICASGDGKTDSCEGDSGGPLVCRQANGKFKQMGIVSWGVGCGEKFQYGVYTDLSKFRAWIDEVLLAESEELYGN